MLMGACLLWLREFVNAKPISGVPASVIKEMKACSHWPSLDPSISNKMKETQAFHWGNWHNHNYKTLVPSFTVLDFSLPFY